MVNIALQRPREDLITIHHVPETAPPDHSEMLPEDIDTTFGLKRRQ